MSRENLKRKKNQSGFTLMEVLVVIVILGILASMVVLNLKDKPDEARIKAAKTDIATIQTALNMYRLDNHAYPSTDEGLDVLVGKYLNMNSVPVDPWGNEYLYLNPGANSDVDIYSLGRDGQQGGENADADIGNWTQNQ